MEKVTECKSLLIFGATGTIGKIIVNSILSTKSSFDRVAVFTSPATKESKGHELELLRNSGVEIILGDIHDEVHILKAYQGIDTVVSALGRNMLLKQIDLIRLAALSPSVHRFFPSEYGTDIKHSPSSAAEIVHQAKLQVRQVLESETNDQLEYTYVVTGPWADANYPAYLGPLIDSPELGSIDIKTRKAVLLGGFGDDGGWKGEKIGMTTTSDVGKFFVAALLHPKASRNRALLVNSFTVTPPEIMAEFQRQTNTSEKDWAIEFTSLEALKEIEKEFWSNKSKLAPIATLRRIWTEGGALPAALNNAAIGVVETDSLADAVKLAIETQLSKQSEKANDGRVFM